MRRDEGTVTVFVTVFMAALMVVAGLVIDGGNTLAARREAADIAESAARAGAEQIDQGALRAGGPITVDPVTAQAAAEHYLAITGVTGSVVVSGATVNVTVSVRTRMLILELVGMSTTTVSASGSARPVQGIKGAGS